MITGLQITYVCIFQFNINGSLVARYFFETYTNVQVIINGKKRLLYTMTSGWFRLVQVTKAIRDCNTCVVSSLCEQYPCTHRMSGTRQRIYARGCTGLRPAQLEGRGPVAPRKARTGIQDNIFSPNLRRLFPNKPTATVVFLTGLLIPSPISPYENKIRVSLLQNC